MSDHPETGLYRGDVPRLLSAFERTGSDTPCYVLDQTLFRRNGEILKRVQEPIIEPTLGQGILLVNGVDWNAYGSELRASYEARAFWGTLPIAFWDCFDTPSGGYPSTLPAPLGHGRVPSSVLGRCVFAASRSWTDLCHCSKT
jgi:hypothetical protein